MAEDKPQTHLLPLARLRRHPMALEIVPDAEMRRALASRLGMLDLRKLRLAGDISPEGVRGWRLDAMLGATVVQPCVVTLEPVTTRIDEPVTRIFVPQSDLPAPVPGEEVEMPVDDTLEPLPETLDLHALVAEALTLALPQFPRSAGADLGSVQAAPEGVRPLTDEQTRPFAALAALRDRLAGGDDG